MGRLELFSVPCKEHELLFDKYRTALETHSKNLQELCGVIGSIPHVEFEVLWRTLQHTREQCQAAQRLLLKHIEEHDC